MLLFMPFPLYFGYVTAYTAYVLSEMGLGWGAMFSITFNPEMEYLGLAISGLPLLLAPATFSRLVQIVADPTSGTLEVLHSKLMRRTRSVFPLEDVKGAFCDEVNPQLFIETSRKFWLRLDDGNKPRAFEVKAKMTLKEVLRCASDLDNWLKRYHARGE